MLLLRGRSLVGLTEFLFVSSAFRPCSTAGLSSCSFIGCMALLLSLLGECLEFQNLIIPVGLGDFWIIGIYELFKNYLLYMSFTLHDLSDGLPSGLYWIDNSFPH